MKSILLSSFILLSTFLGASLEARGCCHHRHAPCRGGFVYVAPVAPPRQVVYVPVQPSPVVYVPVQPQPVVLVRAPAPRPFFNFGFSFLFR